MTPGDMVVVNLRDPIDVEVMGDTVSVLLSGLHNMHVFESTEWCEVPCGAAGLFLGNTGSMAKVLFSPKIVWIRTDWLEVVS